MTISVISGKGGTGKTLYCSILAELLGGNGNRVVVVDMDFAVRGLTSLLYYYSGESFSIVKEGKLGTYDLIENPNKLAQNAQIDLGISKYRTFDVLPSVSRINSRVRLNPNYSFEEYEFRFKKLINTLDTKFDYDYVIVDCRAGYDNLISAIHSNSKFSICIQEEDEISNITAVNLIRQLEEESKNPIFSLVNKSKSVTEEYLESRHSNRYKSDLSYIGSIPFDMDVMASFGEKHFWDSIVRTLYFSALTDTWNTLSRRMDLRPIDYRGVRPFPSRNLERRLSSFKLKDRITIVFGLLIGLFGLTAGLFGVENFFETASYFLKNDGEQIVSLILGISGLFISIYTMLKSTKKK